MKDEMIRISDLHLSYGDRPVLQGLTVQFPKDRVSVIMGDSGCGKTSLLKVMAGLVRPEQGKISGMPEKKAVIFQEPRLLPASTLLDNVALVAGGDREKAAKALTLMELEQHLHKYPPEASGGMKQRVAIARAICYGGDQLLADEPTTGLDRELARRVMQHLLGAYQGKPVILITHEPQVAADWGDRVFYCEGSPMKMLRPHEKT